jgi:hypothetical protein
LAGLLIREALNHLVADRVFTLLHGVLTGSGTIKATVVNDGAERPVN